MGGPQGTDTPKDLGYSFRILKFRELDSFLPNT